MSEKFAAQGQKREEREYFGAAWLAPDAAWGQTPPLYKNADAPAKLDLHEERKYREPC
jgi:hypothetical protein